MKALRFTNKNITNDSIKAGIADKVNSTFPLIAATGQEVRFTFTSAADQNKVAAYVVSSPGLHDHDREILKPVRSEDLPKELKGISNTQTLQSFLAEAYVKVSTLDNGDVKLYVNQKGVGGGKGDRNLPSWNKLLLEIKNLEEAKLALSPHSSPTQSKTPLKAFISYAWEDTSTPEGTTENSRLQHFLENLRDDLQEAGVSVFLDIGDMHGNMKLRMEENLKASDVIIPVVTPRFLARAKAVPETNLGFEYKLTLERAKDIPNGICPVHYKGSFNEAFGKWGDANELKELKGYLIRDCTKEDNYSDTLVATQRPLGIIPAVYNIDCDDNRDYSNLVQNWRYEKLTRLAPRNLEFTGREELLEKIAESLSKVKGESVINQKQAISGLGGVGKTELALEYSHKYGDNYIMKRWIAAEGISLKLEFEQMATELGIDSKAHATNSELARAVYKKLNTVSSWLLIFDNAEDYNTIKDFLPEANEAKQGQHILITSRSQQWKNKLSVDTFTSQEAFEYISKELAGLSLSSPLLLSKQGNKSHEKILKEKAEAETLAKAVGHLPLALSHAISYIKQTGISINAYLKLFEQKGLELFDTSCAIEDSHDKYPHTLLQTMKISLEKVKTQSPMAAKMLLAAGYLSPDNIPIELFEAKSLLGEITEVHKALQILRNYSLIEPSKIEDHIQVHRLVQQAVKHNRKQEAGSKEAADKETEKLLTDIADALKDYCPFDKVSESDFAKAKILLPHMSFVIQSLDTYSTVTQGQANKAALSQSNLLSYAAHTCQDFGNYREAKELYEKALVINEKHYGKDHPEVAMTMGNLGNALQSLGDYKGAKELYEKALVIKEKHYSKDYPNVAMTLQNLGIALQSLGDYKGAKELYEKALVIKEKHYGKDHPEVAMTMGNLGNALQSLGDYKGAKELYEKALVIKEKHYGKDHPNVAMTLQNLGIALKSLGDYKGAKELHEKALVILEKHYGKDHPDVVIPMQNLGNALQSFGDYKGSKELYEKALVIQEKHYGKYHPNVAMTLQNLGNALQSFGDYKGAKELHEKALVILEKHYGKDHPNLAMTMENLGNALSNLGDYKEAKELYKKALVIKEKHYGKDHPEVAMTLFNLSLADEALGNKEAALQKAIKAHKIFSAYPGYEDHPHLTKFASRVEELGFSVSWEASKQEVEAGTKEKKQDDSKSGNKKSSDCIVCKADRLTYDNELLNHPELFIKAAKAFGANKSLELGKALSPDLIDQAAATNNFELLLAGAMSLEQDASFA